MTVATDNKTIVERIIIRVLVQYGFAIDVPAHTIQVLSSHNACPWRGVRTKHWASLNDANSRICYMSSLYVERYAQRDNA